jgi:small subunit ribosomal protein S21
VERNEVGIMANVIVRAKECRGNHERMIKRFIKKMKKEKIIEEVKERRRYTKPSDAKRQKRQKAERRRIRDEQKHLRLQQRRNRKK